METVTIPRDYYDVLLNESFINILLCKVRLIRIVNLWQTMNRWRQ